MATFCKGLSVRHLVRPFEKGCKTAFGLPKSFQEFESGADPASAWPDGGICKCARSQGKRCRNGKKRISSERTCTDLGQHSNRTQEWEKKFEFSAWELSTLQIFTCTFCTGFCLNGLGIYVQFLHRTCAGSS